MVRADFVHPSLRGGLHVQEVLWVVHESHREEVRLCDFFGFVLSSPVLQAIVFANQLVNDWVQKVVGAVNLDSQAFLVCLLRAVEFDASARLGDFQLRSGLEEAEILGETRWHLHWLKLLAEEEALRVLGEPILEAKNGRAQT